MSEQQNQSNGNGQHQFDPAIHSSSMAMPADSGNGEIPYAANDIGQMDLFSPFTSCEYCFGIDNQHFEDCRLPNHADQQPAPPTNPPILEPPAATVVAPPAPVWQAPVAYNGYFPDFAAAHAALQPRQNADPMLPLRIQYDDFMAFKNPQVLHQSASLLLNALQHMPEAIPDTMVDPFQQTYYADHQAATLRSIQNEIEHDPRIAEARVLVCLEKVIELHEFGIPASVLHRTSNRHSFKVEDEILCSQRIDLIISGAYNDKYMSHDILSGHHLEDLVRSPTLYVRRKQDNCRVNALKALDKKTLNETQKEQGVDPPLRNQKAATRKRRHDYSQKKKPGMTQKGALRPPPDALSQLPLPEFRARTGLDTPADTPPQANAGTEEYGAMDMEP